jgi:hypothetical protein
MKKFVFTALVTLIFTNVFAQIRFDNSLIIDNKSAAISSKIASRALGKKTDTSEWFIPINYAYKIPAISDSLKSFIGFLQQDSLAKIIYADGTTEHNTWLSVGQILDPKDVLIDSTQNSGTRFNSNVSYTLDSIRFPYSYIRNIDSISDGTSGKIALVDTLFIAYFKGDQIHRYSFDATQNKYSLVDWKGGNTRMPNHYFKMDTVLLTQNDSTGIANIDGKFENYFTTKVFSAKAPAGLFVNANGGTNEDNLIGYTFTFKSGIATVVGTDTAIMLYQKDPSTLPAGSRRTNYFGFSYAINQTNASWLNPTYFNTSLLAPYWTAYQPTSGWNGYVSGNGFTKEYFINADFYLTYDNINLAVSELKDENIYVSNIYPNPANTVEGAILSIQTKSPKAISIDIVNVMGQKVKSVLAKNITAGEARIDLNLEGLQAGIYFVTINSNGITTTKKITIID